jgi:hypothetical protein
VRARATPAPGRLEAEADRTAARLARTGGSESDVRAGAGRLLGYDFSAVRFHRDSGEAAAEGAHAVTAGSDVHLAPGRFRPDLPLGRALLAHELTHVAQQGAAPRRRPASLADPTPGVSPAPRGMRQRCILGCKSSSAPPGPEQHAGETGAAPPKGPADAGAATGDSGATPDAGTPTPDAGTQPADPGHEPAPGELTEDEGTKPPTKAPAVKIAGADPPKDPYRIIHLSWTMDDGPTAATPKMKSVMGDKPTTWFIMRNQLGTGATQKTNLAELQALEAKGHEIAIHSAHPTAAHVSWFPVKVASSVPLAYASVKDFVTDLTDFTTLLKTNGINPKFVRMPGGEISEVSAYLKAQGVADEKTRSALARKILKQESVAGESAGVRKVAADYDAIRAALDGLGLKLWGGSAAGPMISFQSWEAESSASGLTDNVTAMFKKLVDDFATTKRERSLIVLAHDTNEANAKEVEKDVQEMEAYAASNGVQIQYHTMSSLFTKVRGTAP